ncbi:MAG: EFR1 family ferrodoxin [Candidatus Korarchaeota archaeon]
MKVCVLYFSLYGNTYKIANEIYKTLSGLSASVELVRIWKDISLSSLQCDVLVVGSPVHYFSAPRYVFERLDTLANGQGRPAAIFVTHGGAPATTINDLAIFLESKGWLPIAAREFVSYDYFEPYRPFWLHFGRPNERDLKMARDFAFAIFHAASHHDPNTWKRSRIPLLPINKLIFGRIHELVKKWLPRKKFIPSRCTNCKRCAKACPTGAIIDSPAQQVISKCINCYECARACPTKAISADWRKVRFFARLYAPLVNRIWKNKY